MGTCACLGSRWARLPHAGSAGESALCTFLLCKSCCIRDIDLCSGVWQPPAAFTRVLSRSGEQPTVLASRSFCCPGPRANPGRPSGTPHLASRGPARLLQCSCCVQRGRPGRDKSGGHWPPLRYGMRRATSMPDATYHALPCTPCTIRHSAHARDMPARARDMPDARRRGCDGPACAVPGADVGGGSCTARAIDAPCDA